jgi:hypothetical protein
MFWFCSLGKSQARSLKCRQPWLARQGCYLSITIGEDGKVQDVRVLGGDRPFIDAVVTAVKQFVYEPQLVDGKPSVVTTQANFHFGSLR